MPEGQWSHAPQGQQPGQVMLAPGPTGVSTDSQPMYSVPVGNQPFQQQFVSAQPEQQYTGQGQTAEQNLVQQLQQANVKIMELYNKVGEMERDKLSVENAQAMVKTLDKNAGDYRTKCMELEAQCEQYRRALDTNRVDHEEVLKMSNHIKNLHSKVANLETACDRYKLQEEEWKARLTQAENQARVIHIMSEQLEEWRAKCLALEDTCMRFQSTVKDGRSLQDLLDRMQQEYAAVAENGRQLERANAAMEVHLERSKADILAGHVPGHMMGPRFPASRPTGIPF